MKKTYIKPSSELLSFEAVDVVSTSLPTSKDDFESEEMGVGAPSINV